MPAHPPDGRSLIGRHVRLDRAVRTDAADLFAALDDERVWAAQYNGGPAARPTTPTGTAADIDAAALLARVQYVVRLTAAGPGGPAGTVVGTSSLGDLALPDEWVHLGWTAYAPAVWGTAVNPECKLLLLDHCFTDCGLGRVKIQTDAVNLRSQAAIERLGAVREGTLRRHRRRADGTFRDTVVFSVLATEWPQVRAGLLRRLD